MGQTSEFFMKQLLQNEKDFGFLSVQELSDEILELSISYLYVLLNKLVFPYCPNIAPYQGKQIVKTFNTIFKG